MDRPRQLFGLKSTETPTATLLTHDLGDLRGVGLLTGLRSDNGRYKGARPAAEPIATSASVP